MASQTIRCAECGRESLDSRWSPLCPVCYEGLRQEQRREQVRPPMLESPGWTDSAALVADLERALGPELP